MTKVFRYRIAGDIVELYGKNGLITKFRVTSLASLASVSDTAQALIHEYSRIEDSIHEDGWDPKSPPPDEDGFVAFEAWISKPCVYRTSVNVKKDVSKALAASRVDGENAITIMFPAERSEQTAFIAGTIVRHASGERCIHYLAPGMPLEFVEYLLKIAAAVPDSLFDDD